MLSINNIVVIDGNVKRLSTKLKLWIEILEIKGLCRIKTDI